MKVIYKSKVSTKLRNTSMMSYLTHNKIYDTIGTIENPYQNHTKIFDGGVGSIVSSPPYPTENNEHFLLVICDDNNHRWIPNECFITLDEHRDNIINQLTNESNI